MLIKFSGVNMQMDVIDIHAPLIDEFSDIEANALIPYGEYVLLNREGTKAWFALKAYKFVNNIEEAIQYCIIEWSGTNVSVKSKEIFALPVELHGINVNTGSLIATMGDTVYTMTQDALFKKTNNYLLNTSSYCRNFSMISTNYICHRDGFFPCIRLLAAPMAFVHFVVVTGQILRISHGI